MKKIIVSFLTILLLSFHVLARQSVTEEMVFISEGTFMMGSPPSETGRYDNEGPQHQVVISDFYLGKYEVTQKEYYGIMDKNPSYFQWDDLPVENITWFEAVRYCNIKSLKDKLTPAYVINGEAVYWNRQADGWRLPTEAEWEYAAKGGNRQTPVYRYAGSNDADLAGWHDGNSGRQSHPVGTKNPNSLGLYDMSGNVGEMCWDRHGSYHNESSINPAGAASGAHRVGKGGCWLYGPQYLRPAFRAYIDPASRYSYVGFRLARNAQ
jgi:formylglycine-generating enzyme required for sulfatase activity